MLSQKNYNLTVTFLKTKIKSRGSSRNLATEGFNGLDQPGKIGVAVENAYEKSDKILTLKPPEIGEESKELWE